MDHGLFFTAHLFQYPVDGFDLAGQILMGTVGHMNKDIGIDSLFQSSPKSADQGMGQLLDEAYGVREQRFRFLQPEAPGCRIKGSKQLILRLDAGVGQRIKQRGFACIGIAYQGQYRHLVFLPPAPVDHPLAPDLFDFAFKIIYALANMAPVFFQLAFTGAPGTDAAAQTGQLFAFAAETGQQIAELSQLNL
ncbi:hypothetical protein SDC9_171813 [bioreactor metagenome]|uniref:Uncharacterized protein n=1 Tax=bioreactor metagenome TaxID=1076179 RepID=A0A645GCK7_9ZZZZ